MNTNNVKQARFRLKNYIITEIVIRLTRKIIGKDIQVGISPEGKLNEKDKSFTLTLKVVVRDDKRYLDININIDSVFEYDADSIQELLPFICNKCTCDFVSVYSCLYIEYNSSRWNFSNNSS